jgi:hypothetical protein
MKNRYKYQPFWVGRLRDFLSNSVASIFYFFMKNIKTLFTKPPLDYFRTTLFNL